ncbi:hypothetical protein PPERSA_02065 [Pseudocohnilembus persalinus]|uniref:C3H1-type domain-containing protein n=1 Tax=Pseudocohnilembus persalinus TaxID=266149 RepID=A0A0V0QFA2_PSEPJ|nr:hypothetical protein PPERSA_02065 [Pseudocohnilembus persalinus]|eukprot:KRX00886.1 hypothetical protein PPERSA_02065 [Pseudocohnilembus persalinus]
MKKALVLQHFDENIQNLNQYKTLPNGIQIEDFKYKTELCKNYVKYGHCPYNEKCRFAHGKSELKLSLTLIETPNYKSKHCQSFFSHGFCNYGQRCLFRHDHRSVHQIQQEFTILKKLKSFALIKQKSRFSFAQQNSPNFNISYKKSESQDLSLENLNNSSESTEIDSNSETKSNNSNSVFYLSNSSQNDQNDQNLQNFCNFSQLSQDNSNSKNNNKQYLNQNPVNNFDQKKKKCSKSNFQFRIQCEEFTYQDYVAQLESQQISEPKNENPQKINHSNQNQISSNQLQLQQQQQLNQNVNNQQPHFVVFSH